MTDIVERPAPCARHCEATAFEIEIRHLKNKVESLRQQLAERDVVIKDFAQIERGMEQELAECKAREKVRITALEAQTRSTRVVWKDGIDIDVPMPETKLRDSALALPSDSTALDTMLKAAKLEGWMNGLGSAQAETDSMKKQWQREALLERASYYETRGYLGTGHELARELTEKAKELE